MSPLPASWTREEMSHGHNVLIGSVAEEIHLIAPPGVRVQADELDGMRACWRHAIWKEDLEVGPPALSIDEPEVVLDLGAAEVVEMLPFDLHDFVRVEMARQLSRAESFGGPHAGAQLSDWHAQLAGRTLAWATKETTRAFPEEDWYRRDEPTMWIPGTADELLARMPAPETAERVEVRWFKFKRVRLKVRTEAFAVLASALRGVGGRSERLAVRCDRFAVDDRYEFLEKR